MWSSKQSKQLVIAQQEIESLVLARTAELQKLSQRLLKVQDEERRKIARDLHDSTGQTLAALKMSILLLQKACTHDPHKLALVSEAETLADQAIEGIRTVSYLLHPPLLDEVGFACAAEWYIEGFAKRSGNRVKAQIATLPERLPHSMEIALFRVLQESLTNVHRHSGASHANILFERQDEVVILEVRDFGKGIPEERLHLLRKVSAETGVGLAGMRERLHELHGKLEIESDDSGTIMRTTIPHYPMGHAVQMEVCSTMTGSAA